MVGILALRVAGVPTDRLWEFVRHSYRSTFVLGQIAMLRIGALLDGIGQL